MVKVAHPCHFYLLIEELSTMPLKLKTIYHRRSASFFSRLIYETIICGLKRPNKQSGLLNDKNLEKKTF
jgi:hypothetical protein